MVGLIVGDFVKPKMFLSIKDGWLVGWLVGCPLNPKLALDCTITCFE